MVYVAFTNYQSPETQQFHQQRSETVHSFVDESGVLVVDWGATDTDPPREIVDLILQIAPELIEASATILAAWIATRDTKPKKSRVMRQFWVSLYKPRSVTVWILIIET